MNPRAEPWTQIPGQAPGNLPCTSSPAPLLLKEKGTGVEVKKLKKILMKIWDMPEFLFLKNLKTPDEQRDKFAKIHKKVYFFIS